MKRQETEKHRSRRWAVALMALALLGNTGALAAPPVQQTVQVEALPEKLVPVGHTVGIKLFSEGILVVGLSEVDAAGGRCAPARDCGVKVGDLILSAGGEKVESTEHFQALVANSGGRALELSVRRGGRVLKLQAEGVRGPDGTVRLGAWVRDSLAGIGTMTFYDPASGAFGALGHGINDVDTNLLMPLEAGSIMYARVKAVRPGAPGDPGELRGDFDLREDLGTLYANTSRGVFGAMEDCALTGGREAVAVAEPSEVRRGRATVLSNVQGDAVEAYEVEIERVTGGASQNLVVRVRDQRLLDATGGIVQGMSGSPILQNGKLIGAITHVMVDDPTRGYGIFISNMLQDGFSVPSKKAS